MKNVRDIVKGKSGGVFTIAPDATVLAAIELMAEKSIGSLMVMEGDKLVGIITERDYARKVILAGKSSSSTLVKEIMNQKLLVIQPNTTIEECMVLMIENSVRYLPVIEDGRVVSVISISRIVAMSFCEPRS